MITIEHHASMDANEWAVTYHARAYVYDGETLVAADDRHFDINSKLEAEEWAKTAALRLKDDYEMSLAADKEGGFDDEV